MGGSTSRWGEPGVAGEAGEEGRKDAALMSQTWGCFMSGDQEGEEKGTEESGDTLNS